MKQVRVAMLSLSIVLLCSLLVPAQQSVTTATNATVPPLIPFSSVASDEGGSALSGVVNITFSLYTAQQGGAPLWIETQNNIQLDATGHYSVQLGITQPNGVPTTLFTTGEARWLGVRIAEQGEQPRVLLLSVPYALKAGDAATIGGLPPSAFALAGPLSGAASASSAEPVTGQGAPPPSGDVTGTGKVDYLPLWDSTSDIISSVLFQKGSGSTAKVGINTATPATTLDVKGAGTIRGTLSLPATGAATATAGKNSQPLNLAASAFNSASSTAVNQTFQWQSEPVGNDTSTPSGTLNLLFGEGATKPSETGLNIAHNGQITFATGQTFPGTGNGTITGVNTAAGSGLTGGGTSGTLNLGLLTTCATNQVLQWSGSAWACATISGGGTITGVTAGTDLTGGGTSGNVTLNLDTAKVPQLNTANTFTGNQNVTGNVAATGSVSGAAATFTGLVTEAGALLPASGTATASQGFNSQPFDSVTSVFNSTGGTAQNQDFRWLAEPVGNDTGSPSGKLDLLFGANGATPSETGLSVASNGQITFATGQTFPGGGTVTSVGSGLGLKGGPITTSGTLTIDTTVVPQLGATNTFTGNQTVNGTLFATASSLGMQATTTSVNGVGINALSSATTGTGAGVIGASNSSTGEGVYGTNNAVTGNAVGVLGSIQSTTGYGVEGTTPGTTQEFYPGPTGVFGVSASSIGNGVYGANQATTGDAVGVLGVSENSSAGIGVWGIAGAVTGNTFGVQGFAASPTGWGVYGFNLAATGTAPGVYGYSVSSAGYGVEGAVSSPGAFGVFGSNAATTGTAVGVYGTTASSAGFGVEGSVSSPSGYGVYGSNFVTTGSTAGVYGTTASPDGYGVQGANFATSGGSGVYGTGTTGVFGQAQVCSACPSAGVSGMAAGTTGESYGVLGVSESPEGYAVAGVNNVESGNTAAVQGETYSAAGYGVQGLNGSGSGVGVEGVSFSVGVYGVADTGSNEGSGLCCAGVWGDSGVADFYGVLGTADNGYAGVFYNNTNTLATIYAENTTTSAGGGVFVGKMPSLGANAQAILGDPGCGAGFMALQLSLGGMSNCNNYTLTAGSNGETYLNAVAGKTLHLRIANTDQLTATTGTVNVNGTFTAGDKKFKIDHPLDPANKYLYHTSVESSEMMNIYTGNVTTNGAGLATVQLPDWFEALNKDFRYQLTVIGQFAQAIVASEISHHHFSIRTDKPNVKVSWQVTGVRHDAYANAHSIPVEVEKASADRGHYLYPEAFGQPASARIGYEAPPPASEHVAQNRPPFPRRGNASRMQRRMPLNIPVPSTPNLQQPVPPRPIPPPPPTHRVAPLPHRAALANKLEANQK